MSSAGVIATSGRVFRMASKTPDKFGARTGFFSDVNLVQSNTPADDNGVTKLGNLSNPIIEIGGVVYNIASFSQFLTSQTLSIKDPNNDLVKSDITSVKTHLGTLLTSESYCSSTHNNGYTLWSFLTVFGGATNPPNIFDPLLTSSTSSFSYLVIT
jgi:hypothetical protein